MSPYRAVISDIDDTIARTDHTVSAYTNSVLAGLFELGVPLILVTGRSERSALSVARAAGARAPVICSGGAVVTDPVGEQRLHVARFDPSEVRRILRVTTEMGYEATLWTADHAYREAVSELTDRLRHYCDEDLLLADFDELLAREPISKIALCGTGELLDRTQDRLTRELPGMARATTEYFDCTPPDFTKRASVLRVLGRLGIDPADCIGFGDGDNDIDWMSTMGHRVAVANARPGVLALAHEVVAPNDADGVARYLAEKLLA